jgi:hypothetical protein
MGSRMKSGAMKNGSSERGARGPGNPQQVKAVQQALQGKGHDTGEIDGRMGPKTQAALREFQQKEGLKSTGRADAETMAKLVSRRRPVQWTARPPPRPPRRRPPEPSRASNALDGPNHEGRASPGLPSLPVLGSGAPGEFRHGVRQVYRVDRLDQVPVVAGGQGALTILRSHVGRQREGGDSPAPFRR